MKEIRKMDDRDMEKIVGGITQDEALAAALRHVGLSREQLDFIKKIELDYERGRQVYEISFYRSGIEYEFDIDAASGAVMKFEQDYD